MFEWKVEEMYLTNDNYTVGRQKFYNCESQVSREDKIAFVDSMQDGKLSYLLDLIKKFKENVESLPKDRYGNVKTVSLKSWIKKNDTKYDRRLVDDYYDYGSYNLLGVKRKIQSDSKGLWDRYTDLVDEVFHHQLVECEAEEKKYFAEHDEYSILKAKFRNRKYETTFGVNIRDWSSGRLTIANNNNENQDDERDITIDELKELLSKYEQLDALVEKITEETHIVC